MDLETLLEKLVEQRGTDLHLAVGVPPVMRIGGELKPIGQGPQDNLTPEALENLIQPYISEAQLDLVRTGQQDYSWTIRQKYSTFRCQLFRERGHLCASIEHLSSHVPSLSSLSLPPIFEKLTETKRGLIVVTGPSGSGKNTTCAAMIQHINQTRSVRIHTIEDPIIYVFKSAQSLITQREVGQDVTSFEDGVLSALNSNFDVILLAELRTLETVRLALMLAETGHLVIAYMHAESASEAVQRMIDVFPEPRDSIRRLLARNFEAVIAQRLLPRKHTPGRIQANEILLGNAKIREMITQGNYDFTQEMEGNTDSGMQTLDNELLLYYRHNRISYESALENMVNPEKIASEPTPPDINER